MKKERYIKPAMRVVPIDFQSRILAGSGGYGMRSVSSSDAFSLDDDGFISTDYDR